MSVLDKLMNVLRLPTDEDDDYYNEDYYDDEDEEEEDEKPAKKSRWKKNRAKTDDLEEEEETSAGENKSRSSAKITPISKAQRKGNGMEVCVIRPNTMEDGKEITDTLLSRRTVVLNLEGLDVNVAQRIVDFTSGSCYAMDGTLQKISNSIFVVTPPNVGISGDVLSMADSFDGSSIRTDF